MKLTDEQARAIESRGKVIVSASAGSGKTFVMIEKLVGAVVGGVDLDEVLAVTFTKKAATQMKDKLRAAIIKRLENAGEEKDRLKTQLSKISTADVSTIHSFCARLLRTYFYAAGVDGAFDIISSDDAVAQDLKERAAENLFDRLYEEDDKDFKHLLGCFMKKRSDDSLKRLMFEAYGEIRSVAHYDELLGGIENLYTPGGFGEVITECNEVFKSKIDPLICAVERFEETFSVTKKAEIYSKIFSEMHAALNLASCSGVFGDRLPLSVTRKPVDCEEDKEIGAEFKKFKDGVTKKFNAAYADYCDLETEEKRFFESGKTAIAFSKLLLAFDKEFSAVKAAENKLDYNDLEHMTLKLLANPEIRKEVNAGYKYLYVDEYQDVNPVQEEIISALGGEVFLVGDVKQAIYGFRGSKSVFFTEKYAKFKQNNGSALKLSTNFRSSDGVLNFVNKLFGTVMTENLCGIDYLGTSVMRGGGGYPRGYGNAQIHIFGKEEVEERRTGVYSVRADGRASRHSREGLCVLSIVEEELKGKHYDINKGCFVDTQVGDICILTRKNKGPSVEGIVRALRDEGYPVSGAQEENICALPEVKQILDILSLIDNAEQDAPLVTALLSPLGGFCEDELAKIRIAFPAKKSGLSFRKCCEKYAALPGTIARKLNIFRGQLEKLRKLSDVLTADALVDEILENYSLESAYGAGGEQKLKNVLAFAAQGANMPLGAFLNKLKTGGYNIPAAIAATSDSIKIMSMHASKGLEFPVVIIADVCKTFKGADNGELPFDDKYGFAPKFYDRENMLTYKTPLSRLVKFRSDAEELKNELNLFYVACTRAMCNLHVVAEEEKAFDADFLSDARCYADFIDFSRFGGEETALHPEFSARQTDTQILSADSQTVASIEDKFMKPYDFEKSVNLPVKSSASAILRLSDVEKSYAEYQLFDGEGETDAETGTAYHRFLELCDFAKTSEEEISEELNGFILSGRMTKEQVALLKVSELYEILKMPVFRGLSGAKLYREREFLCRLPANEILDVDATDGVLMQGAIDLLAETDSGFKIIDYKYSKKSPEQLVQTYARQLRLYKKATAVICGCAEDGIETVIVNIFRRTQTEIK